MLTIEDDGTGVPEYDKEKIFSRGFGRNTGLGLFLAREILSTTGMTITETGTYQKGARFEIRVQKGAYRFLPQEMIQEPAPERIQNDAVFPE